MILKYKFLLLLFICILIIFYILYFNFNFNFNFNFYFLFLFIFIFYIFIFFIFYFQTPLNFLTIKQSPTHAVSVTIGLLQWNLIKNKSKEIYKNNLNWDIAWVDTAEQANWKLMKLHQVTNILFMYIINHFLIMKKN
jgi:hypothetical protein